MRYAICIALVFAVGVPQVSAQGGHIGLYADTWGTSCAFENASYEILEVQIVHMDAPETAAGQFMLQSGGGFTGVYLGEELSPGVAGGMGNSRTGISIAYGDCYASPLHIMTVRYIITKPSPKGSYLKIVPDPNAVPEPGIWVVDCSFSELLPASGGILIVNEAGAFCCASTPVVARSWGAIKVLYE